MLLDSNILIYSTVPELSAVVEPFLDSDENAVSSASKVEVLGFHKLEDAEKDHFQALFSRLRLIRIEDRYIETAIILRQQKSMSLGDAIIAATALELDLKLVTRNSKDFEWIDGLEVVNPFDA